MTTFSAYDHALHRYAYYEADVPVPPTGWFRRPSGASAAPEVLAVRVPAGARFSGYGDRARGVVGVLGGQIGSETPAGDGAPGRPWKLAVTVAVAFLVGRWTRKWW